MKPHHMKFLPAALLGASLAAGGATVASAAETPIKGGNLDFVVASTIPSYDAHQETTFGVVQPLAAAVALARAHRVLVASDAAIKR